MLLFASVLNLKDPTQGFGGTLCFDDESFFVMAFFIKPFCLKQLLNFSYLSKALFLFFLYTIIQIRPLFFSFAEYTSMVIFI